MASTDYSVISGDSAYYSSLSPEKECLDVSELQWNKNSPEEWMRNTSRITFQSQQPIWIHKPYWEMAIKTILFLVIIAISSIGNYLIIIVIIKFKNSRNCTNLFICNMAIADFITTILFAWGALIENLYQDYMLGPYFCKIATSAKVFFLIASVFSLTWISCDRLIGIIKPFRNPMKTTRAIAAISVIWLLSFFIASPVSFWTGYRTRQWCDYLEIWCKADARKLDVYWFVILAFLVYIPLFIMTFSYCLVIAKMKRYETKISTEENSVKIKHRRKVILMLFIYLITAAICWSPLQVIVFWRFFFFKGVDSVKPWNEEAKFWAHVFASANSALNPLIYGVINESFRKAICLLYPKLSWFLRLDNAARKRSAMNIDLAHLDRERDHPKSAFTVSNIKKKSCNSIRTISGRNIKMNAIPMVKFTRR